MTLKRHVEKLSTVLRETAGYLNVIDGGDPNEVCSPSNIFDIRERCRYLRLAYEIALDRWEYYGVNSWRSCCDEAVKRVNAVNGTSFVKNGETLMHWNIIFRESGYFPHPNQALHLGKKPEPPMIAKFPEIKDKITEFCLEHLAQLNLDMVRDHVITSILPTIYEKWKSDTTTSEMQMPRSYISYDGFLRLHGLTKVSPSTIWRWVHYIGFRYCEK